MCVALVVEGVSPSLSELRAMEDHNPHGAGLAWPTREGWRYFKGLSAPEVAEVLARVPRPVLVHFRYATHGPKEPRLTHPFPVGHRALVDSSLEGLSPAVLIHNGVWGSYQYHLPDWAKPLQELVSDTQVAAFKAEEQESILDNVSWATAIGKLIMEPSGPVARVTQRGRWYKHEGNQFSNLSWRAGTSRRGTTSSFYSGATSSLHNVNTYSGYPTHGYDPNRNRS